MNWGSVYSAAVHAVEKHKTLQDLLIGPGYEHLQAEHRAQLLGPRPSWAYFILDMHEGWERLVPNDLTNLQVKATLGRPDVIRACAIRMFEAADAIEAGLL